MVGWGLLCRLDVRWGRRGSGVFVFSLLGSERVACGCSRLTCERREWYVQS